MRIRITLKLDDSIVNAFSTAVKEVAESTDGVDLDTFRVEQIVPQKAVKIG
jgi:hypothetical protein